MAALAIEPREDICLLICFTEKRPCAEGWVSHLCVNFSVWSRENKRLVADIVMPSTPHKWYVFPDGIEKQEVI